MTSEIPLACPYSADNCLRCTFRLQLVINDSWSSDLKLNSRLNVGEWEIQNWQFLLLEIGHPLDTGICALGWGTINSSFQQSAQRCPFKLSDSIALSDSGPPFQVLSFPNQLKTDSWCYKGKDTSCNRKLTHITWPVALILTWNQTVLVCCGIQTDNNCFAPELPEDSLGFKLSTWVLDACDTGYHQYLLKVNDGIIITQDLPMPCC